MATFQVRIEDLVGVVAQSYGGSSDTDFINDAMREAIYEIIQTAPEHVIHNFTQTSGEIASNGAANPNMKILAVQRESGVDGDFIECKEMPMAHENKVQNPSSFFYATKQNPVFIRRDAKIYVYPAPSSSPDTFKYVYANYPSGDYYNRTSITGFPDDLEYIVVYGAAVRCAIHLMSNIDVEIKDAMDNVKKLFDTGITTDEALGAGYDATPLSIGYWLRDEDPEMVQSTSAGAQAELARVQSLLTEKQTIQQTIQNLSGAYKAAVSAAGIAQYSQQQAPQEQ